MPGSGTPKENAYSPLGRGAGVVFPNQKDPPRNADAFCTSQGGDFQTSSSRERILP